LKVRLDELLVTRGIAQSILEAQKFILAGEISLEPSLYPLKAGTLVPSNSNIKFTPLPAYVSRGGEKLESALIHWKIVTLHRIALDIGTSTGGFTDCLLQKGVQKVYSVDVGYGQIHPKLRNDTRVQLFEKTHILKWTPPWLINSKEAQPDLITLDLSFISLKRILPKIKGFFSQSPIEFLILVKPQFEVDQKWLIKGVVRDKAIIESVLQEMITYSKELGYQVVDHFPCPILGTKGNCEQWLHLFLD